MTELSDHESLNSPHNLTSNSNHLHHPGHHQGFGSGAHMTLEATEIDYLRRIVYSYMMGTDPVTMAKVIVAVLKFTDEESHKLIENEKTKNSSWLPKFPNTSSTSTS